MSTECRHSGAHCEAKGRSRRLCLPSRTRAFVKICRHSLLMRLLLPPHLLLPSLSLSLHPSVYVSVSVLCFSQQHQDIPQIEIRLFPHQNYQIEIRVFQIKQFRWKFYINHHKKNTIPMLFIEDLLPLLWSSGFREKARFFKESLLQSMANTSCESSELEASCRDESSALVLKLIAVVSILIAGVVGVAIPLVGKNRRFLRTDSSLFVAAKAFAAGVILATGFVHMLNGGSEALNNPCLPEFPWAKFPFSGFFAMMASLATLLVDFVATQYYERKQGLARPIKDQVRVGSDVPEIEAGVGPGQPANDQNGKVFGEEEGGGQGRP